MEALEDGVGTGVFDSTDPTAEAYSFLARSVKCVHRETHNQRFCTGNDKGQTAGSSAFEDGIQKV